MSSTRKKPLSKSDAGTSRQSTGQIHRTLSVQEFLTVTIKPMSDTGSNETNTTKLTSDTGSNRAKFSDSFAVDSQKEADVQAVRDWYYLTTAHSPSKRTPNTDSKLSFPEPMIEGTLFASDLIKSGPIAKSDATRSTPTPPNPVLRRSKSESALLVDDEGNKTPRRWNHPLC
jgi:hypothetical protein